MHRQVEHLATPMRYCDLPAGLCESARSQQWKENLFGYLSKPLVDDLVALCAGRNVLECYAGRGHLSALLRERGVDVRATSLRQGHDASESLGHVIEVEELSVVQAVSKYMRWIDVLLVCWPTTEGGLERALAIIPKDTLIVFIGEVTDYAASPPFLGGCATDGFFDGVEEVPEYQEALQYPTFRQDKIKVYRRRDSTLQYRLT